MDDLTQRFSEVSGVLSAIDVFALFILGLSLLGVAYDFVRKKHREYYEAGANLAIGIGNGLLSLTTFGLIFIITLWIAEQFAFSAIPMNIWTWPIAILLADFSYYWMHRAEHRVRLFWTLHSVHHSSTEFDLTTGQRLAWLESLFEWVFFVPMILIGFDLVQVIVSLLVVVAYQAWIHTEHIGKLGWLDAVVNTPSTHRVHHASNSQYIDKNFGGILMIWDQLFGSCQKEEKPVVYGLTKNIGTSNPIKINVYEWVAVFNDLKKTQGIKEKVKCLVNPP